MSERTTAAYGIVSRYWKWSAVAGLINIPLLDIAAATGVQLKMIGDLSKLYDVPFTRDRAKAIIGALVGSVTPAVLGGGVANALAAGAQAIPGVGLIALIATPAFNAASTYALGRVFVQHFESGGTLLDLDPDKVRAHFHQEVAAAKS